MKQTRFPSARVKIVRANITTLTVEAVVNAANMSLLGGGGVDGAIHRAAGPRLLEECKTLGGCPTGEARITKGYNLPARFVIHTVGPVWHGDGDTSDHFLALCYDQSLGLAHRHGIKSIAFPAISTGVYGYPKARAAAIALRQTFAWLIKHQLPEHVIFCCFGDHDEKIYRQVIQQIQPTRHPG